MGKCECGCGESSTRDFLPGHDQKLRTAIEARVGGVLAMRELVESAESYVAGSIAESAYLAKIRALLPKNKA